MLNLLLTVDLNAYTLSVVHTRLPFARPKREKERGKWA